MAETQATKPTNTTSTSTDMKSKFRDIGLVFLGVVIFLLHVVIYYLSNHFFNVFLAMYIIVFSGVVLYYVYDEKAKSTETNEAKFNVVSYAAIYTIFLYAFIMILSIVAYVRSS